MTISVATPSFKQLDWLRLCVASVRDQVAGAKAEAGKPKPDTSSVSATGSHARISSFQSQGCPPLAVKHIIQDAGSPGIENFAREVGADFYRDGKLISHSPFHTANYSLAIFSERDGGMYDAINRAWDKTSEDVLCYLNSDEQYLPGTIARVAREFETNPGMDIAFGDAIVISADGTPLSYRRVVRPSPAHTRIVHLGTMSCSTFFRRRLFDTGLRFDTRWKAIGDAEWVFHALQSRPKIRMIPEPLAAFTLTGNNLGTNETALAEAALWRSTAAPFQRKSAPLWKGIHFAKKLLAGAYRRRSLKFSLYSLASFEKRIRFEIDRLSYRWPDAS